MKLTKKQIWTCVSATAMSIALCTNTAVHAQTTPKETKAKPAAKDSVTETATEGETEEAAEAIVVTGTNISGVKPVGSEAITLDREAILATGQTNPTDVVRTLPQVRNLGEFREGGTQGGNNNQQGNAINLRGLGQAATLVLVDGHRITNTGASQTFTEANAMPLAALDRIELVADGASAVYGSDAVAGVVNYVIRKDYQGLEASLRASNNNGGFEFTPGVTGGTNWHIDGLGRGNIIVSYEYSRRDAYRRGKNAYLRQDLRQFGGQDGRLNGTSATPGFDGNIVVATVDPDGPFGPLQPPQNTTIPRAGANIYYGIPHGSNVGLTAANLLLNQPNLLDSSYFNDYTGEMKRHQVTAYITQEIGSAVEAFFQGTYNKRSTISATSQGVLSNVQLRPTLYNSANVATATPNPYYIPGLTTGALTVQYNMIESIGLNNWTGDNESYNLTGGLKVKFGEWKGEASYTYGRDKACNYCQLGTNINLTALQYQIDIGAINPLDNVNNLSAAQIAKFTGDNIQRSGNGLDDAVVKFNGPLFALPAGRVRAAIGGERNRVFNYNINGANRPYTNEFQLDTDEARSKGTRTILSAFAELYVPVVSDGMAVPLIRSLTFSGAIRYDHYSDVGATTNPKISGSWEIAKGFTVRGSWGTSFRAPNLPDVNPAAISSGGTFPSFYTGSDPRIPQGPITVAYVSGANPNIGPEKATNWQVGADFEPLPALRFSATYYNIAYKQRISSADVFTAFFNPTTYPNYLGYADFIHPIRNPTTCVNGNASTYDPVLAGYAGRTILYGGGIQNPCSVAVLLDARNTNLAATRQDGLDAQVNYFYQFSDGSVTFNASVNKVLTNKQQVKPDGPFIDRTGFYSSPIEWRGRGSVGLNYHGFNAMLFANYTGSYTNDQAVNSLGTAIGPVRIGSYTTFDFNLGHTKQFGPETHSFVKSLRASINIQNITDKAPRLAITAGSVFNGAYSNPFGRTFTAQLSAGF
ncbi:MAG: TonB-dependent receptor [Sphingobium sp.]|nr:TonB-dependent receptor [Sphingobium sp.]